MRIWSALISVGKIWKHFQILDISSVFSAKWNVKNDSGWDLSFRFKILGLFMNPSKTVLYKCSQTLDVPWTYEKEKKNFGKCEFRIKISTNLGLPSRMSPVVCIRAPWCSLFLFDPNSFQPEFGLASLPREKGFLKILFQSRPTI